LAQRSEDLGVGAQQPRHQEPEQGDRDGQTNDECSQDLARRPDAAAGSPEYITSLIAHRDRRSLPAAVRCSFTGRALKLCPNVTQR
jgi:hypothetical protein